MNHFYRRYRLVIKRHKYLTKELIAAARLAPDMNFKQTMEAAKPAENIIASRASTGMRQKILNYANRHWRGMNIQDG